MEGDKERAEVGVPILIKSGSIDCATHQWSQFRKGSMPGETPGGAPKSLANHSCQVSNGIKSLAL